MHLLQSLFAFLFFYSFFVSKKLIAFESSLSDSFDLSTYTLNLLLMCMKGGSCSAWGSSLLEKSEKIGNWSCQKSFSKQVLWTCLTRNLCFVTVKFEIQDLTLCFHHETDNAHWTSVSKVTQLNELAGCFAPKYYP